MAWTSPADLRAQVHKLWDKGSLLAQMVQPQACYFPLRLPFSAPSSTDLATRFPEVRLWAADLRQHAVHYRLTERTVRYREVGTQSVPEAVWLDSLEAATALIGKTKEVLRFQILLDTTCQLQPALCPWLAKRPLTALALAAEWPRLLAVVAWLQAHPRPGIYLRQVDIAGVDSKFIEAHRSVLAELLDIALPPEAIEPRATGTSQFARRYGFQDKPLRIRLRLLDGTAFGEDISMTQAAFAQLAPPVSHVFITENEVNFLAFPPLPGGMVVFGAGYGFEALAEAHWLRRCAVHYWGDIDTHGFAILDQLRATLPHAQSLLMDRATLLAHADHWGEEPQPVLRNLPRLTAEEGALFDDLRDNRLQPRLRLEQERVGFGWVERALKGVISQV
ncbi:hypothetical protein os1_24420 [Comamonadaceae bacterium OS-1]|nr:hypothetical protein os1_24420 [Comamonadaceae bacterium OS-1]